MRAGFAQASIVPPIGVPLQGVGEALCRISRAIHDPLRVRALSLCHEDREALILTFDLFFLNRETMDRLKGALGREFGLLPSQILAAASHTHAAPAVGNYCDMEYSLPLRDYLREIESAAVRAAGEARDGRREVRLQAGRGRSRLPLNRRRPRNGSIVNSPNPGGPVFDALPVCMLKDLTGKPVCLLFSVSMHPVCMRGTEVSADYPGAAMDELDARLGAPCSMFLPGMAGDSRPRLLGEGRTEWNFQSGWPETEQTGRALAGEVLATMEKVLRPVAPRLGSILLETRWPLQNNLQRRDYEAILGDGNERVVAALPGGTVPLLTLRQRWASHMLQLLDRGTLPQSASILVQGVQLGKGLRMVALEGEPVAGFGRLIEDFYRGGITFALGYANGEKANLVTSDMLAEGGMEVDTFWEYGFPSALAPGMEDVLRNALKQMRRQGIK